MSEEFYLEQPSDELVEQTLFTPACLGADFFGESDYANFTTFDPWQGAKTLMPAFRNNAMLALFAFPNTPAYEGESQRQPIGFVVTSLLRLVTADTIASLFLLYVQKEHRSKHVGRLLLQGAEIQAMNAGAKVFYVGAGAGITDTDDKFLALMLSSGYTRLGSFGRKLLQ